MGFFSAIKHTIGPTNIENPDFKNNKKLIEQLLENTKAHYDYMNRFKNDWQQLYKSSEAIAEVFKNARPAVDTALAEILETTSRGATVAAKQTLELSSGTNFPHNVLLKNVADYIRELEGVQSTYKNLLKEKKALDILEDDVKSAQNNKKKKLDEVNQVKLKRDTASSTYNESLRKVIVRQEKTLAKRFAASYYVILSSLLLNQACRNTLYTGIKPAIDFVRSADLDFGSIDLQNLSLAHDSQQQLISNTESSSDANSGLYPTPQTYVPQQQYTYQAPPPQPLNLPQYPGSPGDSGSLQYPLPPQGGVQPQYPFQNYLGPHDGSGSLQYHPPLTQYSGPQNNSVSQQYPLPTQNEPQQHPPNMPYYPGGPTYPIYPAPDAPMYPPPQSQASSSINSNLQYPNFGPSMTTGHQSPPNESDAPGPSAPPMD